MDLHHCHRCQRLGWPAYVIERVAFEDGECHVVELWICLNCIRKLIASML